MEKQGAPSTSLFSLLRAFLRPALSFSIILFVLHVVRRVGMYCSTRVAESLRPSGKSVYDENELCIPSCSVLASPLLNTALAPSVLSLLSPREKNLTKETWSLEYEVCYS